MIRCRACEDSSQDTRCLQNVIACIHLFMAYSSSDGCHVEDQSLENKGPHLEVFKPGSVLESFQPPLFSLCDDCLDAVSVMLNHRNHFLRVISYSCTDKMLMRCDMI